MRIYDYLLPPGIKERNIRARNITIQLEMASYFHIWMSPGHFHVVLDVASCYLNLSNNSTWGLAQLARSRCLVTFIVKRIVR